MTAADGPPPEDEQRGGRRDDPQLGLEFYSRTLGTPFRDRFEGSVAIDVDTVVRLPDGSHVQYWTVAHGSPERLVETVREFPTTEDVRLVSTVGETHRLEVAGAAESLFSAFDAFDGVTRSAVYDASGVRVVAEFPADVDVDAVAEAVNDVYPDLDLVATHTVETVSVFRRVVEERLTERQLTALQLAYFGGYYEQPRRSTGAELADRMGISRQAFHEHLRKAYAAVFEELLESGFEREAVDS